MPESEKMANIMKLCQVCLENKENIDTCDKHHYCKKYLAGLSIYLESEYCCVACYKNNSSWKKKYRSL